MSDQHGKKMKGVGLVANGSSDRWSVAIDETLDGDGWSLEIDAPHWYLVFQIANLAVPERAVQLLQAEFDKTQAARKGQTDESGLVLGRFGSTPVSLVRDNEDFSRCFLIVGGDGDIWRVTLDAGDIERLTQALRQANEDLGGLQERDMSPGRNKRTLIRRRAPRRIGRRKKSPVALTSR